MARQELKKPMADLWDEHRKLELDMIPVTDKITKLNNEVAKLRQDEFSNKEALNTLPRSVSHNAARNVLKKSIDGIRISIEAKSKELDIVQKDYSLLSQKLKNIKSSIKNLNEA